MSNKKGKELFDELSRNLGYWAKAKPKMSKIDDLIKSKKEKPRTAKKAFNDKTSVAEKRNQEDLKKMEK